MAKYNLLLIDADNTLLDFDRAEHSAFMLTMAMFGQKADENLYSLYSKINDDCWKSFERGEITRACLLVKRFEEFFAKAGMPTLEPADVNSTYLFNLSFFNYTMPFAEELLKQLHGNIPVVIASNGVTATQHRRMGTSVLYKYISDIVVSEETGTQKPDPAFFAYTFEKLGVKDLSKVLMVGDSLTADIKGGALAGIDTCWYNPNKLPLKGDYKPTYEIFSLLELPEIATGK